MSFPYEKWGKYKRNNEKSIWLKRKKYFFQFSWISRMQYSHMLSKKKSSIVLGWNDDWQPTALFALTIFCCAYSTFVFHLSSLAVSPSPPLSTLVECDFERRENNSSKKSESKIIIIVSYQRKFVRHACVQLDSHPVNVLMRKRTERCMLTRIKCSEEGAQYLLFECVAVGDFSIVWIYD